VVSASNEYASEGCSARGFDQADQAAFAGRSQYLGFDFWHQFDQFDMVDINSNSIVITTTTIIIMII
jgi:hypothetical protein